MRPISRWNPSKYLALSVLITLSACGSDTEGSSPTGPEPTLSSVTVSPAATTLVSLGATASLAAEATLSNGSAASATFAWSSSDSGVATVASDGTVTAVADGTTTITAAASSSSGSGSGTAQVTVGQVAATLSVTPSADTIVSGGTVMLTASAADAGGSAITRAPTWTSSDEAVAVVDASGLVTGTGGGSVQITASLNDLSDVATLLVELEDLALSADTTLSGTLEVKSFAVPAGVTVTVEDDLVLTSSAPIVVEGTIAGGCGAISLVSSDSVRITGTVSTTCATEGDSDGAIVIEGVGWSVEGATLAGAGRIRIGPEDLASAARASSLSRSPARANAAGEPCRVIDVVMSGRYNTMVCQHGPFFISGLDITVKDGKDGESVSGVGEVSGGGGGWGNYLRLASLQDLTFTTGFGPNTLRMASGGNGGDAIAAGPSPVAHGGRGGEAGGLTILSRADLTISGTLTIIMGRGGDGGVGRAVGDDGTDASETSAATNGAPALAFGGEGGGYDNMPSDYHGSSQSGGSVFHADGELTGLENVAMTTSKGGDGGKAVARPGVGGNGSEAFPNGGHGGAGTASGGTGGEYIMRMMEGSPDLSIGGNGGDADGQFGNGGMGWSDCVVGNLKPGGNGGNGGDFSFSNGLAGQGGASDGVAGSHTASNAGNGGAAGRGVGPGDAGTAGVPREGLEPASTVFTNSFANGAPASGCAVIHETSVSVLDDPSGHEPFIGMTAVTSVTVELGANNTITLSGSAPWITVTGTLNADGTFALTGSGTAAGNTGTDVTFTGSVGLDSDGRIATVTGTLSVGTNGNLPTGKAADYTVSTSVGG